MCDYLQQWNLSQLTVALPMPESRPLIRARSDGESWSLMCLAVLRAVVESMITTRGRWGCSASFCIVKAVNSLWAVVVSCAPIITGRTKCRANGGMVEWWDGAATNRTFVMMCSDVKSDNYIIFVISTEVLV